MAKLQFGAIITGLRGSIGGQTFSAGPAGPYVHNKPWFPGPRTPAQRASLAAFSLYLSQWRDLSLADKADWNDFAADPSNTRTNPLGQDYNPSGLCQWLATQTYAAHTTLGTISTPPELTPAGQAIPHLLTWEEVSGSPFCEYVWDTGHMETGFVLCYGAMDTHSSQTIPAPPTNFLKAQQITADVPDTTELTDEVLATWGTPRPGWRLSLTSLHVRTDGRYSVPNSTATPYTEP